jgi:hypothetical protein
MADSDKICQSTREWWKRKRGKYNILLLTAGAIAFILSVIATWTLDSSPEITLFTKIFQGIGYLFAMGLANICYFMGPISEKILHPSDPQKYGNITFKLGCVFSCSLPMLLPFIVVLANLSEGAR